jgi:hypothetical protein
VACTAARRTGCRRIGCGWPVAGRAAAQTTESPGRSWDPGIPCGRPLKRGFLLFKKFQKNPFPLLKILENPFLLRKLRNLFQKISKISNYRLGWCLLPFWILFALIWI